VPSKQAAILQVQHRTSGERVLVTRFLEELSVRLRRRGERSSCFDADGSFLALVPASSSIRRNGLISNQDVPNRIAKRSHFHSSASCLKKSIVLSCSLMNKTTDKEKVATQSHQSIHLLAVILGW
jgi:hypothetical protein